MNNIQRFNKRLLFIITGIIIFSMIAAFGYNLKAFRQSQAQRTEAQEQALRIYVQMMENFMDDIETLVISQSMDKLTLQKINRSRKEIHYYQALSEKKNSWNTELAKYKMLNGLFLYDTRRSCYIGVKSSGIANHYHTSIKKNIYSITEAFHNAKGNTNRWFSLSIEDEYYLFYMISVDDTYFGAWMKPENMISYLEASDSSEHTKYFISDSAGTILNRNHGNEISLSDIQDGQATNSKYEFTKISSRDKEFTVLKTEPFNWGAVIAAQFILPLFLILSAGIFVLCLVIFLTKKTVISPIHTLLLEEELEKKNAQLQFLQSQISPHFLNNCLSLIRNLILTGRASEAADASVILSKYTRTSLHTKSKVVLAEELEHVNAYLQLQKLRYKDSPPELITDVPENLGAVMVPAMIIQTFVENAVKHQTTTDKSLKIYISIYEEKDTIHIHIADTGNGFSEKALKAIHTAAPIIDEHGFSHVGLYNIVQRIRILYGREGTIQFRNGSTGRDGSPHTGAVIDIFLPVQLQDISEEKNTE